jgi:hypothetical protein
MPGEFIARFKKFASPESREIERSNFYGRKFKQVKNS